MKPRMLIVGLSKTSKGGVESYIMNLIRAIGYRFDIYIPLRDNQVVYRNELEDLEVHFFDAPANRHNLWKYIMTWNKIFKKYRFDVLYFNACDVVSTSILRYATKANVPVRILHAHSTGNESTILSNQSVLHRIEEKRSRAKLDNLVTHFFACSKNAGDYMFDGRPYIIIKNGIQLSAYEFSVQKRVAIRNQFSINSDYLIVIIGRLSPPKNPLFTAKILTNVLKGNSDIQAIFLGDGELRHDVENEVKNASLSDRIRFVGSVSNVNEWMSAADCLLMPSVFEGLPFVLVEAQAAGLPCVVSSAVSEEANISGKLKYIGLEEPFDVWKEAILQAVKMPRYDARVRLVEEGYSIEDSAGQVVEIINKALAEGK